MTSPLFVAGQRVTAADLNALQPTLAVKASDQTVNNSAVLVNDTALAVALAINAIYIFELGVIYTSGTTPDIKVGFTIPTGAATAFGHDYFDTALTRDMRSYLVAPTSGLAMGGNVGGTIGRMFGTVTTVGNSGNMQVVWAQNTANASDTVVKAGSYLAVQRVS